jgi:hypothetical protein
MLDIMGSTGEAYRPQVGQLRVAGSCGCGCPTIYFQDSPDEGIEMLASAGVPDGSGDMILLLGSATGLHTLEYVPHEGKAPDRWPEPESLTPLHWT